MPRSDANRVGAAMIVVGLLISSAPIARVNADGRNRARNASCGSHDPTRGGERCAAATCASSSPAGGAVEAELLDHREERLRIGRAVRPPAELEVVRDLVEV